MNLLRLELPWWARLLALALAFGFTAMIFQQRGERIAGQRHIDYVTAQATQTVKIAQAQIKEVVRTEIEYRDRIKTIYIKGDVIEKQVPIYVTAADNAGCTVNTGFVRSYDSGWSGEPAGAASESDREPAGVSLAEVAAADAFNATACHAWREQALGLRALYQRLQAVTNQVGP